jgi:hypothetical protein
MKRGFNLIAFDRVVILMFWIDMDADCMCAFWLWYAGVCHSTCVCDLSRLAKQAVIQLPANTFQANAQITAIATTRTRPLLSRLVILNMLFVLYSYTGMSKR